MAEFIADAGSRLGGLLLLLFIVLIVALVLGVGMIGELPLTRHAEKSHQSQPVNAQTLMALITAGSCFEVEVYECPAEQTIKILCKIGESRWGGLIIGTSGGTHQVITGYEGTRNHWENKVQGCRYTGALAP
jgi:hypothetical protein